MTTPKPFRLMSYNVRTCRGWAGRAAPERIARLIDRYKPDAVALHEVDRAMPRTGTVDQADFLARWNGMNMAFASRWEADGGQYGIAVLSRTPVTVVKAAPLPSRPPARAEKTMGLWVEIPAGDARLQLITAHFFHDYFERHAAAVALAGEEWIGAARAKGPTVFCGDLNCRPVSPIFRTLSAALTPVPSKNGKNGPVTTWPSLLPLVRIDHLFASPDLSVRRVFAPWTLRTALASDHLPLIADFTLPRY
jgi:endonuclease/exonuclease/phosphatase family metal-dependent hydrolase